MRPAGPHLHLPSLGGPREDPRLRLRSRPWVHAFSCHSSQLWLHEQPVPASSSRRTPEACSGPRGAPEDGGPRATSCGAQAQGNPRPRAPILGAKQPPCPWGYGYPRADGGGAAAETGPESKPLAPRPAPVQRPRPPGGEASIGPRGSHPEMAAEPRPCGAWGPSEGLQNHLCAQRPNTRDQCAWGLVSVSACFWGSGPEGLSAGRQRALWPPPPASRGDQGLSGMARPDRD